MTNVETPNVDTTNDAPAGTDGTDDKDIKPSTDPVVLAGIPLSDLAVTQWSDSRISNLDHAVKYWNDFESAATDWFASRKANRNATRRAAIATARMAELVVNDKGEPIWSAQLGLMAWRVLYQERVKPLYVKLATDTDDPKAAEDFATAVRQYIANRKLTRVVMADYCVRHTNGLGTKPFTTGRGAPAITTREALTALLADDKPDNMSDLENYKWNADLIKAVKPHIARQTVKTGDNKGNRQRGFETDWTSVQDPANVDTNKTGGGSKRSAGEDTYVGATKKLVHWPTSEHWNPLGGVESVQEILTADAQKFLATLKQIRNRKDVVATLREIEKLAAVLADAVEDAGKTGKPSKADVEKWYYVA
jgi:hypothetical protein